MSKIKDIRKAERPREKLQRYGAGKLNNSELLAIILGNGTKGMNVIELAKKLLRSFSNGKLVDAELSELQNISGLGPSKACEIVACFELGRRFLKDKKTNLIFSPKDVWENLRGIRNNKKEHFIVFYLDVRNQEIKREIISVGILDANLIHPREVFEPAILHNAAQILVAHNHPSNNIQPSGEDIEVTHRLVEAGKILGIDVVDHVIVSSDYFSSMKNEGLI